MSKTNTTPSIKDIYKAKLDNSKRFTEELEIASQLLEDDITTPLQKHDLMDILSFIRQHGSYDRGRVYQYSYDLKLIRAYVLEKTGHHPKINMDGVNYALSKLALEGLQYTDWSEMGLKVTLLIAHFLGLKAHLENKELRNELEKVKSLNERKTAKLKRV